MKRPIMIIVGLIILSQGAGASDFEQQLLQIQDKTRLSAERIRHDLAVQPASLQSNGLDLRNPADAMDESKAGIAAKFIPIGPGEFRMGSPADEYARDRDEGPTRLVRLEYTFEMQATEVTQLQYFSVMGFNPAFYSREKYCDADNFKRISGMELCVNHPVEYVSWSNAQEFIARLNKIQTRHTYRLPTEAEWEYAARAGTPSDRPYPFGFNETGLLDSHGWYRKNSGGRPHAVASKRANPWGLYDMHGNVWELVQDMWHSYKDAPSDGRAWEDSGMSRVMRGGSWENIARQLRSANRLSFPPSFRRGHIGFRLVRTSR